MRNALCSIATAHATAKVSDGQDSGARSGAATGSSAEEQQQQQQQQQKSSGSSAGSPPKSPNLHRPIMQAMPDTRQQSFDEIYGAPENFLEIEVSSWPLPPPPNTKIKHFLLSQQPETCGQKFP